METQGMAGYEFSGHTFSDVDRTGRAVEFIRYLDEHGSLPLFQAIEQRIVERLEPRPGGHYLDVGCGTGDDARALARLVGPTGEVVGLDSSEAMIAEARKRADGSRLPVSFQQADAHRLPFPDGAFDGCRVERTLQHLDDPQQAVREMARVTRSGGCVVAFEPDWGTTAVDAADRAVTRAVLQYRCDSFRSGWIGRQLPRLFRRAGLVELEIEPRTNAHTDHAWWMASLEMESWARRAQEAGVVTAEAVAAWLAQLAEAGREETFLVVTTGFLVSARKR